MSEGLKVERGKSVRRQEFVGLQERHERTGMKFKFSGGCFLAALTFDI